MTIRTGWKALRAPMNEDSTHLSRFTVPRLPRVFCPIGLAIACAGIALAVAKYRFKFMPKIFETQMFAISSVALESKSFKWIHANIGGDVAILLVLVGLYLATFSRERVESALVAQLRARAFFLAITVNTVLLLFLTLTIFGFGYIGVLVANLGSMLAIYQVVFRYLLWRDARYRAERTVAQSGAEEVQSSRVAGV